MSRQERPIVACVEDADDHGNVVEGAEPRYASSVAPSSYAKEQPNTSRARREKNHRRGSSSPLTTSALTDSDSTVHPRRDTLKKSSKDREKSASKKALMATSRPPVKHTKTTPNLSRRDGEAVYYGVDPALTPAVSRPRAQTSRPSSYYAPPPSRPPPANARFYMNQTPSPSIPIPPPSWGPGPGPGPGGPLPPFGPPPSSSPLIMHHPPPPPPPDYFARPLESRFGPSARPQSAMGFTPPRAAIEYDDYEEPPHVERSLARRPSTTRKVSKNDEDRRAMPPPRRPASARPTTMAYRPPPSTPAPVRRSVGYDDRDEEFEDPLFGDLSPMAPAPAPSSYEFSTPIPYRPRQPFGADVGYDAPDYQTEIAGRGHRRNSYYGGGHVGSFSGSALDDNLRQALRYQEIAAGGAPLPLTAESLRKAGRNGGSSRSTRSSGSHDESDYRQSATTRTTRSSAPNDENFTIRVKGSTVLKFGGAEMQCQDGAEININSRTGAPEVRAIGSDRSSYVDQDDRRTRVDHDDRRTRIDHDARTRIDHDDRRTRIDHDDRQTRIDIPMSRNRAKSRARSKSYSRPSYPAYDDGPEYDSYGFPPPLPPPYPAYPSSYDSRQDDGYFSPPM